MDRPGRLRGASDGLASPLYYASLSGLSIKVWALLDQGANVNAEGGEYGNTLQAASPGGHKKITHCRRLGDHSNLSRVNCQAWICLSGNLATMLVPLISFALQRREIQMSILVWCRSG